MIIFAGYVMVTLLVYVGLASTLPPAPYQPDPKADITIAALWPLALVAIAALWPLALVAIIVICIEMLADVIIFKIRK